MDAFFNYFYNFMSGIFLALWNIVVSIWDALVTILDVKFYMDLFSSYRDDLTPGGWIAALITHLIVLVILILVVYLIARGLKVLFRFKVPVIEHEALKDEVVKLKRQVMKANYEKDKILAMKVSELGMEVNPDLLDLEHPDDADEEMAAGEEEQTQDEAETEETAGETAEEGGYRKKTGPFRFPKLNAVDEKYNDPDYTAPEFVNNYNLEELCSRFRSFSASRLGLYYELELVRQVFASFGAARILILQGISGTGKTSLPYAIGQFIQNPSMVCSVQPSWRDRTELFGYYNDFTKKYSETEFLKTLYECSYQEDMKIIILDEMNIARVEYYFAEMLSILELPRDDERYISIISSNAENDPDRMEEGKIWIPSNVFYVGTINNDDSTFAVADKVYDRAIPIDLDDKARVFEAPDTEPLRIQNSYLQELYAQAKKDYPISEENLLLLDKLDQYLIDHFRLTFGNRIMKQMKEFVPCYVACGGTEVDGIDFMFAKKILRKFESLGLGFIRDELDGLLEYLDHLYGKENFKISKKYLLRLKKMSGS